MGLLSWFIFQHVCCWYIQKLMIFTCWFCTLLLCWKCLLDFSIFWQSFQGLLSVWLYCLKTVIIVFLPFLFVLLLFLSPALLLYALAKNSSTILNKSEESGHSCFISDFKRNYFSFSPTQFNVGCRFVMYDLYYGQALSFYF
jgi:hypothetical protein